jgi:hypothetical protein
MKAEKAGSIEYLPSKYEALSSNPKYHNKRKELT